MPDAPPKESRAERWLDRELKNARTPRGAATVIAVVTTTITIAAGASMRVVDHNEFHTFGQGLWWAVQTVTTVGYGDHVPESVGGQILASVVMLLGIGFVTVITASITSAFVARARDDVRRERQQSEPQASDQLAEISARLDRIEAALKAQS